MFSKLCHKYIHIPSRRTCDVYINGEGEFSHLVFHDDKKRHEITKQGLYCKRNLRQLAYQCDF